MKNLWINRLQRNMYISTYFILFVVILLCLILYYMTYQETFEEEKKEDIFKEYSIDFYVITMGQEERLKNIQTQTDKINKQNSSIPVLIKQIEAINGENLNLYKLAEMGKIQRNIVDNINSSTFTSAHRRKFEVGCYLSHIKTYNEILSKNDPTRYSIIFEDDFDIQDNFIEIMNVLMKQITENKIDFDVLCLGLDNPINSDKVSENIYKLNCNILGYCFGAHAYMVPNSKVEKILQKMAYIDDIYDIKLFSPSTGLNVLRSEPFIVNQLSPYMGTTIR